MIVFTNDSQKAAHGELFRLCGLFNLQNANFDAVLGRLLLDDPVLRLCSNTHIFVPVGGDRDGMADQIKVDVDGVGCVDRCRLYSTSCVCFGIVRWSRTELVLKISLEMPERAQRPIVLV